MQDTGRHTPKDHLSQAGPVMIGHGNEIRLLAVGSGQDPFDDRAVHDVLSSSDPFLRKPMCVPSQIPLSFGTGIAGVARLLPANGN